MKTIIKNVEQLNDVLIVKGKLVFIESFLPNGGIDGSDISPIIISEIEKINIGDSYLKDNEIYNCIDIKENDARHGRIIIHSEKVEKATISFHYPNTCRKILSTPEQIPESILKSIINVELEDGDDVYLECERKIFPEWEKPIGTEYSEEYIKLNQSNQVTILKTEETWDDIFNKYYSTDKLNTFYKCEQLENWLKENYKTPENNT